MASRNPSHHVQIGATLSEVGDGMYPFFYAFVVFGFSLFGGGVIQAVFCSRDRHAEDTGADHRSYQEARDEDGLGEYRCSLRSSIVHVDRPYRKPQRGSGTAAEREQKGEHAFV